MAGCCKTFFKILTIFLALVDIGIGWWKFYEIYHEAWHLEHESHSVSDATRSECQNPRVYWIVYIPFESMGTILAVFEIYYLVKEVKKDKSMFNECFSRAWFVVVAIYIFSIFPSSILDIVFRDKCVCNGGFSVNVWQSEVRDFSKGLIGGLSVIFLQILLHLAEAYYRIRRVWRFFATCLFCMKFAPDEEMDKPCCQGTLPCFVISLVLAICYTAVFVAEIVYIFCVESTN